MLTLKKELCAEHISRLSLQKHKKLELLTSYSSFAMIVCAKLLGFCCQVLVSIDQT